MVDSQICGSLKFIGTQICGYSKFVGTALIFCWYSKFVDSRRVFKFVGTQILWLSNMKSNKRTELGF